jgi:hypothetical protein
MPRFPDQNRQWVEFLRLPCAYGEWAVRVLLANTLIELVEREGLEPSTPAL